jgi:hypothetical protein
MIAGQCRHIGVFLATIPIPDFGCDYSEYFRQAFVDQVICHDRKAYTMCVRAWDTRTIWCNFGGKSRVLHAFLSLACADVGMVHVYM